MKKVGIVTIIDKNNYGNRLQNYALSYFCENVCNSEVLTLENYSYSNNRRFYIIRCLRNFLYNLKFPPKNNMKRKKNFDEFDKNINYFSKKINCYTNLNEFDFIIVGSDQVWNPFFRRLRDVDVLKNIPNDKRISYAASFGGNSLSDNYIQIVKDEISKFKNISVREDSGKKILEEIIDRRDVEVLIDPTMLLTSEIWEKVMKKPLMLKEKKYILNYFLGELSEKRKNEIERIAEENDCEVINILDDKSLFYECGPSEFLWLEKNAFLICTDSFHSSVFAILFNKPFVIFDREQKNMNNMNSRLETLISKFKLKNRKFDGKIKKENLEHDYSEAYKILEIERKKSEKFLKKALDIKE